ncbi:hypothetical protein A9Q99_10370 [Gammaproteobacteria bacterium 45_16_T64]|nr:hypothetical protein A9Q99_10370 [Gammaproteobacteria bacterium 45_16_T64]
MENDRARSSVIGSLHNSVLINVFLVLLLAVFFIVSSLNVKVHSKTLDSYIDDKYTLDRLNTLITETAESLLRLLVVETDRKYTHKNFLTILSQSEDFQAAFDQFYDATIKRKGISEQSLAREIEPVITELRRDIVKCVSLYRAGNIVAARNYYNKRLYGRTKQVRRFT